MHPPQDLCRCCSLHLDHFSPVWPPSFLPPEESFQNANWIMLLLCWKFCVRCLAPRDAFAALDFASEVPAPLCKHPRPAALPSPARAWAAVTPFGSWSPAPLPASPCFLTPRGVRLLRSVSGELQPPEPSPFLWGFSTSPTTHDIRTLNMCPLYMHHVALSVPPDTHSSWLWPPRESRQCSFLLLCLQGWTKSLAYNVQQRSGYVNGWAIQPHFICLFIFGCIGSLLLCAGFSLVAASGGYSLLRCAGFSLRWLLLWSTGSRHAGFSSCGMRPQ